jgi:Uma2 family endonuclease
MVASRVPFISPEAYLKWEENAEVRHEYIDGELLEMARSGDAHGSIVLNGCMILKSAVRGTDCRAYPQDVKAKIQDQSRYYYPDLMVTCDVRDRQDKYVKRYYKLIVEVLSEGTEAFDRGKKFEDYRRSETLEEYVLVAQDRISVDVFRRTERGRWELQGYGVGDEVELVSLGARFPIGALYEDVDIAPEADE